MMPFLLAIKATNGTCNAMTSKSCLGMIFYVVFVLIFDVVVLLTWYFYIYELKFECHFIFQSERCQCPVNSSSCLGMFFIVLAIWFWYFYFIYVSLCMQWEQILLSRIFMCFSSFLVQNRKITYDTIYGSPNIGYS